MKFSIKENLRKIQKLLPYVSVFVVIFTLGFTFEGFRIRREFIKLGVEVKPMHHLIYMAISTIIVYLIKEVAYRVVDPMVDSRIEKIYPPEAWKEKKTKGSYYAVGLVWYSIISLIGTYLCWDAPNVPRYFLGSMNGPLTMQDFPAASDIPYLTFYYMLQMGSRNYSMIRTLLKERHLKNFHEMFLHHLLTLFLMLFSYFTNTYNIGVIVLLIHDWGDWGHKVTQFWKDIFPHMKPWVSFPIGFFLFSVIRCVY